MMPILIQLCLFSLFCSSALSAQQQSSPELYATYKHHNRFSVRHIEGGGIGYNKGYTTAEGFFSHDFKSLPVMPFLDVKAHVFNNGKLAANVGAGIRGVAGCRVYGANAYYDYRKTHKKHYNQVGFGLEALGRRGEFHINGYVPVGDTITDPYQARFAAFAGNSMILSQQYQFAMKGFNAELGCHAGKFRSLDCYLGAGPYYYTHEKGLHFWGGKARLIGRFKEYVTLELSNSYDKHFHNKFQCELTLNLPFGGGDESDAYSSCKMPNVLFSRMMQPVIRQEIPVVACRTVCTPAINPATCAPFKYVFVDNTSNSLGTYESPYPTLAQAQANSAPGDIIYVFPGDGTTKGMDTGIILQQDQKLWGAGTAHSLTTAQGDFVIPAQSATAPQITNPAGIIITLAPTNRVSGFTLINAFDHGIFGTAVEDVEISECTINNSLLDLVHLEYGVKAGSAILNRLTLINGMQDGIFISAPGAPMQCTVSDCIIKNNQVYTINSSLAQQAQFNVRNNIFESNVNGANLIFSGPSTLLVSGNTIKGTTSVSAKPLTISAGASSFDAKITNNNISNNETGGIHFILNNSDSANLTVCNNTISNNDTGAVGSFGAPLFIDSNGTNLGSCSLHLANNTLLNNTGVALYSANGDFDTYRVDATDNTLNGNGGGLSFANSCDTFILNATNNVIINGNNHGITTSSNIITAAQMNISHNTITGNINQSSAIALSHAGTNLNLLVAHNNLSDNEGSGIILYSSSPIQNMVVEIAHNMIANNQNLGANATGGCDVEEYINLAGSILNNTCVANAGPGLYVASTDASPSVCIELSGNASDTGYTLSNASGVFNVAPCSVATVNTGAITTIGTITTVQSCPGAGACPP